MVIHHDHNTHNKGHLNLDAKGAMIGKCSSIFLFTSELIYVWSLLHTESTKEYKGRTGSNSPTGPIETVCLATLLL